MITAYLGLGSNLGNRLAFMRGGRDALLERSGITLVRASGVYETTAVGGPPDNPPFLNAILEIATTLTPAELLAACLAVEDEFGRTRPERWAPRTLDIDILLYADQLVDEPDLVIPHPRLHERSFVLAPLAEIAPELHHPGLQRSIADLADACPGAASLKPLRETW